MTKFKKFCEFVNEGKEDTYDYGCAMIYFENPDQDKLHAKIAEEDIYTEEGDRTFGLETEPHTTLLYGLHKEVSEGEIFTAIEPDQIPKSIKLENVSMFENKDYDVLKFDTKEKALYTINEKLTKFPHTTDFPDYHPHATIAYLKKGKAAKYIKEFKEMDIIVKPTKIVYSKPDGSKATRKI